MARARSLEIDDDMEFQRRDWIAERAGWVALWAIPLAALAGLLGAPGPLGATRVSGSGGFRLTYPRIARAGAPFEIEADLSASAAGPASLFVSASLLDRLDVHAVTPEPVAVASTREGSTYEFAGSAPHVVIRARTERLGRLRGDVRSGAASVAMASTVLP